MKKANLLSLLLVSTMLVACGGGSSSTDEGGTGTGGGDTGTDGGTGTGGGDTGTGGGDTDTGGGDTGTGGGDTGTGGGDTGTGGGDTGTGGGDTGTGGGDTGTGGGDTGTGGGDTGTGGGDTSDEVNPFADGNIPTTKESLRSISSYGEGLTITFDPVAGKYSVTEDHGYIAIEGDYDPVNLTITQRSCESAEPDACEPNGTVMPIEGYFSSLKGNGLVLLSDGDEFLELVGYNPTDEANLPSGKVTYTGKFAADVSAAEDNRVTGDAKTIVDFDTDKLSAEFTNFDNDDIVSAGIDNVSVTGSKFSGGEFTFTTTQGTVTGGETDVFGEFFGEKGQELGGSLGYEYYDVEGEDPGILVDGVWTGKK